MKTAFAVKVCVFISILYLITESQVLAQKADTSKWTTKKAGKWIKSREWANGITIKLNSATNKIEFAQQYFANKIYWDKAFLFIKNNDLKTIKPGKYVIDGENVFANITEAPSKTFEQSAWESHRKYIDLQYVITGKEKIGVSAIADAIVTKPYDEAKDGANYTAAGKYFIANPEEFFLFFPGDVHRPNIKVMGFDTVKKLVIKIAYATLK